MYIDLINQLVETLNEYGKGKTLDESELVICVTCFCLKVAEECGANAEEVIEVIRRLND